MLDQVRHAGWPLGAAALLLSVGAAPAQAATGSGGGPSESLLLLQIIVLLACGRLLGELMQRIGQPTVMGQLLAGVLLGPSVFGALFPDLEKGLFPDSSTQKAMLSGLTQIGILLLLLLTGMETDLKLARRVGKTSLLIALTGLAVPFACGFALGESLPDSILPRPELRLVTSLFLGTALSISSVKIVAMVIREMEFMRRNVGQAIIAAAIIEDSIGWIIIAITFSIAVHGSFDAMSFLKSFGGTLVFLALSFTIGRKAVARLIRWANDSFVSELPVITVILIVMGIMALITDAIGVHTVLGAFVAGMLVGQSPILTRHIDEQLRGLITALFMPVFFAVAGLGTDLTVLSNPTLLALTLLLIAIASFGKFSGAFLGGWIGGLNGREAFAVGAAMNARGSTEVIVASIGLSMGALSHNLYTMIVAMAFLTTLAMPPMLRWGLARIPMREEERKRLDREQRDAAGFVSSFQRIMLVSDGSENARFAGEIAGLIAGSRQILTTVLTVPAMAHRADPSPPESEAVAEAAVRTARAAVSADPETEDTEEPDITTVPAMPQEVPVRELVTAELRKGYDMMMVGLGETTEAGGLIAAPVSDAAQAFDGPLVVIDARGQHLAGPRPQERLSILLPIRATRHSRQAAEFAMELARASRAGIEAVFVTERPGRRWSAALAIGMEEEGALKEVVGLAETFEVPIRTSIYRSEAAAETILRRLAHSRHNLVVLGVSRRPGERLFFGQVAAEVLSSSPCSVILVSS